MDDLTYVLAELMGLSQEEADFGGKLVKAIDAADWRSVFETGDYIMTLRPDHIGVDTWRLTVAGVMMDATSHDISNIETTAGMTFVQNDGEGFKVAHFSIDDMPATLV
jgi:hypothetical protein